MDFKFISHRLWSEAMLHQHMHKKEFGILTNKCGNKLKHETEAEGHGPSWAMVFVFKLISLFDSENPKFFFIHVLTKDVQAVGGNRSTRENTRLSAER